MSKTSRLKDLKLRSSSSVSVLLNGACTQYCNYIFCPSEITAYRFPLLLCNLCTEARATTTKYDMRHTACHSNWMGFREKWCNRNRHCQCFINAVLFLKLFLQSLSTLYCGFSFYYLNMALIPVPTNFIILIKFVVILLQEQQYK